MVSLHTGLPPLQHGVLGYLTHDPEHGQPLNQLIGDPDVVPEQWMPEPGLGERTRRRAVQVAPGKHAGSHLSRVAYRGWEFLAHGRGDRVEAVRTALHRVGPDGLVHLHVDDVDHAGHRFGVDSDPWRTALAEVDSLLGTMLRRLPAGTRIHVTADHGMVDTSPELTVDLTEHPSLQRLAAVVAGEARALALTAVSGQGAAEELAHGLDELMGERALVLSRQQLLGSALLGPAGMAVPARVRDRVPDVLVLGRGCWTVDDFSRRPESARQRVGVHGSLTSAEAWGPRLRAQVCAQSFFDPEAISSQLGIAARLFFADLAGLRGWRSCGVSGEEVPCSPLGAGGSSNPGNGVRSTVSWWRIVVSSASAPAGSRPSDSSTAAAGSVSRPAAPSSERACSSSAS